MEGAMVTSIDREEVQRLANEERGQLVEVLPRAEYEWAHLPAAAHLHLKEFSTVRVRDLDRGRPVVVYCNNLECDMSPRAARRLERLGFPLVFDYAAGKMDWLSYGLPHEGSATLAGDLIHRDVPTCDLGDRIASVREKLTGQPWNLCVVVDDDQLVQGVVRRDALDGPPHTSVEQVMQFGPTTVRPSEDVDALAERMRQAHVGAVLVTRSDGRLLGLLVRADAEQAIRASQH
jgi:rhodanese-related sulfurtransferase/CBS domain-containing protein